MLAERLLAPVIAADVDALLLGCTHYPFLSRVIGDVVGADVTLVSSADETAFSAARLLGELGLLRAATAVHPAATASCRAATSSCSASSAGGCSGPSSTPPSGGRPVQRADRPRDDRVRSTGSRLSLGATVKEAHR